MYEIILAIALWQCYWTVLWHWTEWRRQSNCLRQGNFTWCLFVFLTVFFCLFFFC